MFLNIYFKHVNLKLSIKYTMYTIICFKSKKFEQLFNIKNIWILPCELFMFK